MIYSDNKSLRFCKIKKGTKKPFERDWTNKPYTWEEIQDHIKNESNFGVLCGYGGLIVIDSDTPELKQAVEKNLPETSRVKTGSGGTHDYYICKDVKKKIVLQIGDKHFGEVQSYGAQVVGAGSIHPNGNIYELVKDKPICEITQEQLFVAIKPFIKEVAEAEVKTIKAIKDYGSSDINSIPITQVMDTSGFKKASNGELYGANKWHGSDTGANTWINQSKNVAHCFRCDCGINVAQAIALNEGIISRCSDTLAKEQFLNVLEVAKAKYGLQDKPKIEIKDIPSEFLQELQNPKIFLNLIDEIKRIGEIVNEDESLKTILLCEMGAFVENNKVASYNLIVNSKSGTGKDHVVKATSKIWNSDVCIKRTRISPTAFTYWHNSKFEPSWTWDGKILILEDISENLLNSEVFKVMQSSGSMATITINQIATDIEIKGKPILIITTAKSSPNIELLRRNSLCQLNESEEQTKEILSNQAKSVATIFENKPNEKLIKSLRYLQRHSVIIPFAEKFVGDFPTNTLIMRTAFSRFLDYIKASACLHQYQRESKSGFLIATGQDYEIARGVLQHLTKGGGMIPISRTWREILDALEDLMKKSAQKFETRNSFSVVEINNVVAMSDKWLRVELDRMVEAGLLELNPYKNNETGQTIRAYNKAKLSDNVSLRSYEEICRNPTKSTEHTKSSMPTNTTKSIIDKETLKTFDTLYSPFDFKGNDALSITCIKCGSSNVHAFSDVIFCDECKHKETIK